MKEIVERLKKELAGSWAGEGFAKFPTIENTAYTEQVDFIPDADKDAIFYNQKTKYKNDTAKNGHTVFWDTGFILLKEENIFIHSVQIGGRMESYQLIESNESAYTFNSLSILNDPKSICSQKIYTVKNGKIH